MYIRKVLRSSKARLDVDAFYTYVYRSKAAGRMITINLDDPNWEEALELLIQQAT